MKAVVNVVHAFGGNIMKLLKSLGVLTIAVAAIFMVPGNHASARVAVSIGPAPVCPYGYYEVPPLRIVLVEKLLVLPRT